ncbi:MAG: hypothetical protein AAF730_07510, partial [Bacteroidota bacterium]
MMANAERKVHDARRQENPEAEAPEVQLAEASAQTALTKPQEETATVEVLIGEKIVKVKTNAPVVLTRREQRVKDILLKELMKLNRGEITNGEGLTYDQRQHIKENLTIDYIDKQIAHLRKTLRWFQPFVAVLVVLFAYQVVSGALEAWQSPDPMAFFLLALVALNMVLFPFSVAAHRRKLFIFEALRELTNADEVDVLLDDATREADALIQRIVDR